MEDIPPLETCQKLQNSWGHQIFWRSYTVLVLSKYKLSGFEGSTGNYPQDYVACMVPSIAWLGVMVLLNMPGTIPARKAGCSHCSLHHSWATQPQIAHTGQYEGHRMSSDLFYLLSVLLNLPKHQNVNLQGSTDLHVNCSCLDFDHGLQRQWWSTHSQHLCQPHLSCFVSRLQKGKLKFRKTEFVMRALRKNKQKKLTNKKDPIAWSGRNELFLKKAPKWINKKTVVIRRARGTHNA